MSCTAAHLRSRSLNIVSHSDMIEGFYRSWDLYTTGQLGDDLQQKKKTGFHWTEMKSCRLFKGDNFNLPPCKLGMVISLMNKNSKFKPFKLSLKNLLMSHPACTEEIGKYTHTHTHTHTHIYIYIYTFSLSLTHTLTRICICECVYVQFNLLLDISSY